MGEVDGGGGSGGGMMLVWGECMYICEGGLLTTQIGGCEDAAEVATVMVGYVEVVSSSRSVAVLSGCVTYGVLPRSVWTLYICVGLFHFSSTPFRISGSVPSVRRVGFVGRVFGCDGG